MQAQTHHRAAAHANHTSQRNYPVYVVVPSKPAGRRVTAAPAALAAAPFRAAVRKVLCRSTQDPSSSSESAAAAAAAAAAVPPAAAAAAAVAGSNAHGFSDPELRQLWDSVSRSLLKLGKGGLSDTHINSLRELLSSHKLVKVQLNAAKDDAGVAAAAADVAQRASEAGVLLQVKGRTLLFGNSSSSKDELLAVAEASTASTAVWKAKRQMKKAEAAAKREGSGQQRRAAV